MMLWRHYMPKTKCGYLDVIGIHPPIKDVNCWSLYMCYEISKIERFWTYPDGKPSE